MEKRYQDLIENVSSLIVEHLVEDRQWLEENHRLRLDGAIFKLMMALGLAVFNQLLEHLVALRVDRLRQKGLHINDNDVVDIQTKLGTAAVSSPYLRNRDTGESARPAKDFYGLRGNSKTLELEKALSDFGSEDSYAEAERMFERHYGFNIGRTSILRVTRRVGEDAEEFLEERLANQGEIYGLPPRQRDKLADELLAQLDGCLIRTGKLMKASQAGLTAEDGYEPDDTVRVDEWREVRTGLVRGMQEVDPLYACRLGDYQTICDQLFGLAVDRGLNPETHVIGCGDGAHGLSEAMEVVFANFTYILDYSHLKDHFYETAEALEIDQELRSPWVYSFLDELWEDDVDDWEQKLEGVLGRLQTLHDECANERLDNLIDYLDKFSEAVEYRRFEDNGWPTGSGEVESAHKYLPQARLKLPGACWRVENINPMMAVRVIKKNDWWEDFWQWRENQKLAA